MIPGISYFYGNWTDARARQLIVLGDFLAAAWFAAAPASVAVSPMCDDDDDDDNEWMNDEWWMNEWMNKLLM